MTKKLVITYEAPLGGTGQEEFNNTPMFYSEDEWIIFAKGVLAHREIPCTRILELYTTEMVYSAYDEGLKALAEDAE